jgi:hypothetical protein
VDWLLPWHSIADGLRQANRIEQELRRELSIGHPLYGLPVRAVGYRQDRDDVLFAIEDATGRVAVVHLTYHGPEQPPWPCTVLYSSFETWVVEGMQVDHNQFE